MHKKNFAIFFWHFLGELNLKQIDFITELNFIATKNTAMEMEIYLCNDCIYLWT